MRNVTVSYDVGNQMLEVIFSSGETYRHYNVPETIYKDLMRAKLLGYYLHTHIRNSYPCERIS